MKKFLNITVFLLHKRPNIFNLCSHNFGLGHYSLNFPSALTPPSLFSAIIELFTCLFIYSQASISSNISFELLSQIYCRYRLSRPLQYMCLSMILIEFKSRRILFVASSITPVRSIKRANTSSDRKENPIIVISSAWLIALCARLIIPFKKLKFW